MRKYDVDEVDSSGVPIPGNNAGGASNRQKKARSKKLQIVLILVASFALLVIGASLVG